MRAVTALGKLFLHCASLMWKLVRLMYQTVFTHIRRALCVFLAIEELARFVKRAPFVKTSMVERTVEAEF